MALSVNVRAPKDALMPVGDGFEMVEYNALTVADAENPMDEQPDLWLVVVGLTDPSDRGVTSIDMWGSTEDYRALIARLTAVVDAAEAVTA